MFVPKGSKGVSPIIEESVIDPPACRVDCATGPSPLLPPSAPCRRPTSPASDVPSAAALPSTPCPRPSAFSATRPAPVCSRNPSPRPPPPPPASPNPTWPNAIPPSHPDHAARAPLVHPATPSASPAEPRLTPQQPVGKTLTPKIPTSPDRPPFILEFRCSPPCAASASHPLPPFRRDQFFNYRTDPSKTILLCRPLSWVRP